MLPSPSARVVGCSFLAALFGFAPVIVTFSLISATFACELSPALGVDGRDGPSCGLVSLKKVAFLFVAAGSGDGFTRGVGRFVASTWSTGDASELPPPVFQAFGVPLLESAVTVVEALRTLMLESWVKFAYSVAREFAILKCFA